MDKKNIKRIGRTAMSGVLVLGMVLCNSSFVEAKKVSKQESVYATAGADGTVREVIVADWLQDSGLADGVVRDSSDLTDITNVKGDETFTQADGIVEWNVAGQDIYYQGKTTKELPVGVKITYALDGMEMSAQDMVGKSGKLEIRVTYTNHARQTKKINGRHETIYTPFVMGTGMVLPSDQFSHIEIDNGRVINDGSRNIVVGIGVPGLAESLGAEDDMADTIPEGFTVTADVTDFSMGDTFTFGTSSLLDEIDLDDVGNMDELEDKLDDLTDATGRLLDGSGKLADNMSLFDGKMGDLKNSIIKYRRDGVKKLARGIRTLAKNGSALVSGVNEYTAGVVSLSKGTKAYVSGADKIADGSGDLYTAVKGLPGQIATFDKGLKMYTGGVDKMGTAENVTKLKTGARQVSDGISTVNRNVGDLKKLNAQGQQLVAALKLQLQAQGADSDAIAATVGGLEQVLGGEGQYIDGLELGTSDAGELKQGADALSDGVATVMDSLHTLSKNSASLTEASGALNKQVPTLVAGIKTLKEGGEKLTKNNKELTDGANKLIKSSKKMKKSARQLNKGMKALDRGGNSLQKSTNQLVGGIAKLEGASGQLSDGADSLAAGVSEFDKEGIQKIVDVYEDDFKVLLERLKAVVNAGRDYSNFSGIGNGMDGDVKFLIKTESVGEE